MELWIGSSRLSRTVTRGRRYALGYCERQRHGSLTTAGKRLELLRGIVPRVHQLAILANVDNASAALEMPEVQSAAVALGIEAIKLEIRRAEDIAPAVETAKG